MQAQVDSRLLALDCIEAVGEKNFDRVTELLHPDAKFVTSGPAIRGAPAFVDALRASRRLSGRSRG